MVIAIIIFAIVALCLLFAYEIHNAVELPDDKDILDL